MVQANPLIDGAIKTEGLGKGRAPLSRYKFMCDRCGRIDYNDNLPPGWQARDVNGVVLKLIGGIIGSDRVQHFCPICKVTEPR